MASGHLKRTIEEIELCKVPQLKKFLQERGWRSTGSKKELVALVFAAEQIDVPKKPSALEKKKQMEKQYQDLLTVGATKMPDPFELKNGWEREENALDKWPPTMMFDIAEYILQLKDTSLAKRLLGDYKEGKAYSYVESGFIDSLNYHAINQSSRYCFLKTKSLPSQCHSQTPHRVWVLIEKASGTVVSGYCTCFAGLGSTCNHVAALLFTIDKAWREGWTAAAPTSRDCVWKGKKVKDSLLPGQILDYNWSSPHFQKQGEGKPINTTERQLFKPTDTPRLKNKVPALPTIMKNLFPSCHGSAVFQNVTSMYDHHQPSYGPGDDINVKYEEEVITSTHLPMCITEVAGDSAANGESILKLPTYTSEEIEAVEEATRGQSDNPQWKKYRKGLITASTIHQVKTKVDTLTSLTSKRSKDTDKLVRNICLLDSGPDPELFNLKYGREMEDIARTRYIQHLKEGEHRNIKVEKSGLVLSKQHSFVGASPDGIVSCECCCNRLVEIKCVVPRKRKIDGGNIIDTVDYLQKVRGTDRYSLKRSHQYYSQIQTQLAVTGLPWADFFVLFPKGSDQKCHVERIDFDEMHWKDLFTNAKYFFWHFVAPFLLDSHTEQVPTTSQSEPLCEVVVQKTCAEVSDQVVTILAPDVEICDINNSQKELLNESPKEKCNVETKKRRRRQTRKRKGNVMPLYICGTCNNACGYEADIKNEGENSVQCDLCKEWFHWACVNFCKDDENVAFYCPRCIEKQ